MTWPGCTSTSCLTLVTILYIIAHITNFYVKSTQQTKAITKIKI